MTIAHRALGALCSAAAICIAAGAPAQAQQRNSILERYSSQATFESAYAALGANHYRVVDINFCYDPAPTRWWVVVYQRDPAFTPDGTNALVWTQPNLSSLRTNMLALEAGEMKIDDFDANSALLGRRDPPFVALQNVGPGRQEFIAEFQLPLFLAQIGERPGFALVDVEIYPFEQGPHYFGLLREGAPQANLYRETSWAALEARRVAIAADGWRLRNVAAREGEYWGLFNREDGPQTAGMFDDWSALRERFAEVDNNGAGTMRLDDVDCFNSAGAQRYVGVWSVIPGRVRPHPEAGPRPAPPPRPRAPRRPRTPPVDRDPG
ncbi:MAG TPA: hypothetical protein VEF55_02020 [Candidatus Binatia bacterium]|nr:hypothetical protein [Candidatus Binatia bacterium]